MRLMLQRFRCLYTLDLELLVILDSLQVMVADCTSFS